MEKSALGIIETYGYVGGIEALDQAAKSALVKVIGIERVGGGLINITVSGDVAAVKAAMDSANIAARTIGYTITTHVIPRPDDEVWSILPQDIIKENIKQDKADEEVNKQIIEHEDITKDTSEEKDNKKSNQKKNKENESESEQIDENIQNEISVNTEKLQDISIKDFSTMKVVELRKLARKYPVNIKNKKIKSANKDELIKVLTDYFKKEGDK